jgi:hypothetical protein
MRPLEFVLDVAPNATASVLSCFGNTRVICAVTIEEDVPRWMKNQHVPGGWLTAEYAMLPYSTLDKAYDFSSIEQQAYGALIALLDLKHHLAAGATRSYWRLGKPLLRIGSYGQCLHRLIGICGASIKERCTLSTQSRRIGCILLISSRNDGTI